jgi:hypothetical protein
MNTYLRKAALFLMAFTLVFTACKDSGSNTTAPVEAQIITDIPANVNTVFSPAEPDSNVQGNTETNPGYSFYDLDAGRTIDDSTSADWDIAFGGTTILANSGNGGGIQLVATSYSELQIAPESGFEAENSTWFNYTGEAPSGPKHAVLPKEDHTLVVLTSDGKYAKVQILNYYEGAPDTNTPEFESFRTRPAERYFTFNYTLQNAESTELFHEDKFTYFDLDNAEMVDDAESTQWDIAFKGTTIIANDVQGGGLLSLNIDFENVDEAPTSGYTDINESWYRYTGEAPTGPKHAILPKEGQTFVVKTPEGMYAKFRILNYYKGNPDLSSQEFANVFTRPKGRYYTIEFAVQTDGSTMFE